MGDIRGKSNSKVGYKDEKARGKIGESSEKLGIKFGKIISGGNSYLA